MHRLYWLLLLLPSPLSAQAAQSDVYGIWESEAKDGHIEISDCGNGTPCGALVWVDPHKTDTLLDARNKNKDLRSRALLGVPIIWDLKPAKSEWKHGKIYNPEDGKTFKAHIKQQSANSLQVKGCLGPLCITNIWTRVLPKTQINEQSSERYDHD